MLKKKNSKIIAIALAIFAIWFVGNSVIESLQDTKRDYYLNTQSSLLQTEYRTNYKNLKNISADVANLYTGNVGFLNLFDKAKNSTGAQQDAFRKEMYTIIFSNYKRLSKMGVEKINFYFPDNTSFLNMEKPSKFGEVSASTSLQKTNATKKIQSGFEMTESFSGLHFSYPIIDADQQYLGSIQVSFSSSKILQGIDDSFSYGTHILLSQASLEDAGIDLKAQERYAPSWEINGFYIDEFLHQNTSDINLYSEINHQKIIKDSVKENIGELLNNKKAFTVSQHYNYQNILLTYIPLYANDKVTKVAYIVQYTISDYLSNIQNEEDYIKMMHILALLILTLLAVYMLFSQEKIKSLALYDEVTELPNRTLFTIEFQNEIIRAMRYKHKLGLFLLSLDNLQSIRDNNNDKITDKLLVKVAKAITDRVRQNDIAARISDDEFAIILVDVQDAEVASKIAEDILGIITQEYKIDGKTVTLTTSTGISLYPDNSEDVQKLLENASNMMQKSQEDGENKTTVNT